MEKEKSILIDGEENIKKGSESVKAESFKNMDYRIVRTYSAGVFAGYVESRNGREVMMRKARRLYYWDGAATLSQLAEDGVSKPQNCKFPKEVDRVELLEVIEILDCSKTAQESIGSVKIWSE